MFKGEWTLTDESYTMVVNEQYFLEKNKIDFEKKFSNYSPLELTDSDKESKENNIKMKHKKGKAQFFIANGSNYVKTILEQKNITESTADSPESDILPEDDGFTYYDPSNKNKLIGVIKLFDNQYEDQHKLLLIININLKTTFKKDPDSKIINFDKGVISVIPQKKNLYNMIAFKYYNISSNYNCSLKGQFTINQDIFIKNEALKKIDSKKLKEAGEVFYLRLHSDDPACPINFKVSVKLDSTNPKFKMFFYTTFIIFIGLSIIRGGYKVLIKIIENPNEAKKYSLITIFMICIIDIGLLLEFLYSGK